MIESALLFALTVLTFLAIAIWMIVHYLIDDAKPHKRPLLLISGTAFSLFALLFFCFGIDGIEKGAIDFRRHFVRSDNPIGFWHTEIIILGEGAVLAAGAIFNVKKAFKLGKKSWEEIAADLDSDLERKDHDSGIWTCPHCGVENRESHDVCRRCGRRKG